jgi:hypothetical protein
MLCHVKKILRMPELATNSHHVALEFAVKQPTVALCASPGDKPILQQEQLIVLLLRSMSQSAPAARLQKGKQELRNVHRQRSVLW